MTRPLPLTAVAARAAPEIRDAISSASRRTGVSFDYLLRQAEAESSFDPRARAKSSSAAGLYQFIERTWLDMVKQHGAKYGLGEFSDALGTESRRDPINRELRQKILELRHDPDLASAMAAEYARGNQEMLRASLGREPSAVDLYLAHFLGPAGATQFLRAKAADGSRAAADLLPEAAAANRNVFFAADGAKRSVDDVFAHFAKRFETAPLPVAATSEGRFELASSTANIAAARRSLALQVLAQPIISPLTIAVLAALDEPGRTNTRSSARDLF
jgi:soluble lytic murein transglycosylase-like protein